MDATLLNIQRRNVFEALKSAGNDPLDFEWATRRGQAFSGRQGNQISALRSKIRPEFEFIFDFQEGAYRPTCSPWVGARSQAFGRAPWESCLTYVHTWAQLVWAELNTPDPWQSLPAIAQTADIAVAADAANTEFSVREAEQVTRGLNDIRSVLLEAVGQSNEKIELINREITRLEGSSKKMGRKDWLNQAIGALLMITWSIAAPPEVTKQVFQILKQSVSGIVQLAPHILAGGQHLL